MNVTGRSNIAAVDVRVGASTDDAEEQTTGSMSMSSSKLDMMLDVGTTTNTNAMIGMRFLGLGIPSGTTITNAYLQFTAAQVQTGPITLTMQAQAADDAPALTSTKRSLTSRTRTAAAVTWNVTSWVQVNDSGSAERSPDLTAVVQEVVNRAGWTPTSALTLLVTGTGSGVRVARSYDGAPTQAALLHVEYQSTQSVNTAPTVTIGSPAVNGTANQGDPVPFQATAQDNEDGNVAASLVWTSSLDGEIGTGPSFSRYDLRVGTHTITATATDSDSVTSSATRTIKIFAPAAVLVGAGDIADCSEQGDEATAKILDSTPGTVFTVGDNVYPNGTASEFTNCYDPTWGRHKLRTKPAAGNHDYNTTGATGYYGYFGGLAGSAGLGYYSYDVTGWHVVVLNSEISSNTGSTQEMWLRADLASHPAVCTAAIFHRPLFSSGTLHGSEPAMKPFWQALYDYGADVVLNGHEHNYERFAPQTPDGAADSARGIREFVIGTGGASEVGYTFGTPLANSEIRASDVTGVLKLTLKPSGYDWQLIGVPGQTFTDSGSGTCVVNQAPVVNAGPDASVTLPSSASLDASVSDDGLPTGSSLTTGWTKVSGPGTVTFADAAAVDTTAAFSTAGTYALRLTANDTALTSTDDLTITVQLPDLIFADGFESGTFSAWSSSTTNLGDLSVTAAAALAGTRGMQGLVNDNQSIFVRDDTPVTEPRYRARFLFHPHGITMAKNDQHVIFTGLSSTGAVVLQIELRYAGSSYQLRAGTATDGRTVTSTSWFTISNALHALEFDWRASSAVGANDGQLTFWIDSTQKADLTAVDNDTRRVEAVQLGGVSGIDSGTRGLYFFDAFESHRRTFIGG
jgi:hypothetical protein